MRIRLHVPCEINGRLHQPGEVVTLPDGVRGPHRAVAKSHDRITYPSADRIDGEREDVPLYDELPDEPEGGS